MRSAATHLSTRARRPRVDRVPSLRAILALAATDPDGIIPEAPAPSASRAAARKAPHALAGLDALLSRGWLKRDPCGRLRATGRFLTGRLSFTRSGSAFVDAEDGNAVAFVPPGATHTAFHGDVVRAWVPPGAPGAGRLPEAMVVSVLRRGRETLTAQISTDATGASAAPLDPRTPHRVRLPDGTHCPNGTWVSLRLDPWDAPEQAPTGRVAAVLGPDGDPATDSRLVALEYGLPSVFPQEVLREADRCRLRSSDRRGRLDLRDRFVITIDPADSQDFDDALSLRRLGPDAWELAVHVADVSHFVRPGGALDREALTRGCSTYLPGQVIPMLPERLSNDLCSLNPGVDRLAFTALAVLSAAGEVRSVRFAPSVIRSRRRLCYAEALATLSGTESEVCRETGLDPETVQTVRQLHRVAEALTRRRHAAGALELASTELKLRLDQAGHVTGLETTRQDAAHRLVEECMLLANEYACRTLAEAGVAQLHRIHPEPEFSRVDTACAALRKAGVGRDTPANRADLARLLSDLAGRDDAAVWTATLLRALPRAEYAVDAAGHFGLAKAHYAHFTSPIRRYPDLVTHRLLKALLAGQPAAVPAEALRQIAGACSERERLSQRAERHLSETKRLRWLADGGRRRPGVPLEAIVVDTGERGADVYLPECGLFGWLPRARVAGEVRSGSRLTVLPARIDALRRELEVMPCPAPGIGVSSGPQPAAGRSYRSKSISA